MDPFPFLVIGGAAGLLVLALGWRRHVESAAQRGLQAAAKELGFTYRSGVPGTMEGFIDGVEVAGGNAHGFQGTGYRFTARELPATVTIVRASGLRPPKDVETGDAGFDRAIHVDGEPAVALALLDASTRDVLLRTVGRYGGSLRLDSGVLALEYAGLPTDPARIARDVRALREAAAALRSRYPLKGRAQCLAENVENDPLPAVRYRNLEALLEHRDAEPARRAFEAALAHGNAATRLVGAIGLSDAAALRTLAVNPDIAALQRSRAALVLAELLPDDQAETALLHILPTLADAEADLPVIERLGRIGTAKSVERLHERAGVLTAAARAASDAITKIQARISGAGPGQMSLVAPAPEAGAVSISEAGAGALSLPKAKREPMA